MARHRKRHHRRHRYLSNPLSPGALLSKPKEMFTQEFALEAVGVAAGFAAPDIVMGYLPAGFRDSKVKFYASKILVVAALSTMTAALGQKKASRFVLIGGGVSLLFDLWAEWQARSRPAPAPGTSAYYGDEGMGAYYGDDSRLGADIVMTDAPEGMY